MQRDRHAGGVAPFGHGNLSDRNVPCTDDGARARAFRHSADIRKRVHPGVARRTNCIVDTDGTVSLDRHGQSDSIPANCILNVPIRFLILAPPIGEAGGNGSPRILIVRCTARCHCGVRFGSGTRRSFTGRVSAGGFRGTGVGAGAG